jgi:hypothetical protein
MQTQGIVAKELLIVGVYLRRSTRGKREVMKVRKAGHNKTGSDSHHVRIGLYNAKERIPRNADLVPQAKDSNHRRGDLRSVKVCACHESERA